VTSAQTLQPPPPRTGLLLASLARADLSVMLKNKMRVILSLLLPLIILSVTNSAKALDKFGGSLFVIGLSISFGLASVSIMGYASTTARDRENGVFQRLRLSPAPRWAIMGSRLALQLLVNEAIAVVVLIIAVRQHHLSLSARDYALELVVALLGSVVFLAIGQALVGLVKRSDTVNALGRLLYIALALLGIFGQNGELSGNWGAIARWSPVGDVMRLLAGVLDLSRWTSTDWWSLVACAGYIVFCGLVGVRFFQWNTE
jgi:ABC-2 type transport system permease protein